MAKVSKVQIRNYKSINDSGLIDLEEGLTIFAGKNESGKTSLLQALEDFDTEKEIRKESKQIKGEDLPEIEVVMKFKDSDIKDIEKNLEYPIDFSDQNEIKLRKDFDNKYHILSSHFSSIYEENAIEQMAFNSTISFIEEKITSLLKKKKFSFTSEISSDEMIEELKELDLEEEQKNKFAEEIEEARKKYNEETIDLEKITEELMEEIKRYIPYFIFFDTSEDQKIPDEVPFEELNTNSFIQDLKEISDLNLDLIKDAERNREQVKHQKKVNIDFKKQYKKFWEQDLSNVHIDWRNGKLFLYIEEGGELYSPQMRSKGRQWHLAFYVKVGARTKEDKPNLLLIDEPGLFLHSKAQRDILRQIKESSDKMQIIYSTHSPYLIDPNNLENLRLVEKDEQLGTKVFRITAKTKYQDTLTPVLTAIGEDQTLGIRVDKPNSIVTEGFVDFLWLKIFKKLLGKEEINLIPGMGGGSPANIGSILFGWGLNAIYILDNDAQGQDNQKKLMKKLGVNKKNIILVPLSEGGEIENLFSNEDRKKYINLSEGNKRVLATNLLNKIERQEIKKEDFEDETINNFEELFKKIEKIIEENE